MTEHAGPGLVDTEPETSWSEEAEISVLGAMLIDDDARQDALERLEPDDFHREGNRRIFEAFARLNGRGAAGDVVTLSDELKASDDLEAAGGMGYLAELVDAVPTPANVESHARIVREHRVLRELKTAARETIEEAGHAGPGQVGELLADAQKKVSRIAEKADTGAVNRLWDYADLVADPELAEPPEEVVPLIAFREHLTLLSSDPKGGKTTLAAAGAAAVANGDRLFGSAAHPGRVLWIQGEGHRKMVRDYLQDFGAEPEPGRILGIESGPDPLGQLEHLVRRVDPALVIIDTWTSWTAPLGLDYWKAADVAPVLKRLEAVARSGPAVILLHHNRRADGQPRGSGHIMAAVDLLRTVEDGDHDRERKVKGRGRIACEPFRYTLVEAGDRLSLQVVDPNRETEEKILDLLEVNPGASKRTIREGVDARAVEVDRALGALERDGVIDVDRSGRGHTHRIRQNPQGHAPDTVGHGSGHGSADQEARTVSEGGRDPYRGSPSRTRSADSAGGQP